MEGLVTPLQDRIEEWKKTANQLDKDHAKGEQPANYERLFVSTVHLEVNLNPFFFFFFFDWLVHRIQAVSPGNQEEVARYH